MCVGGSQPDAEIVVRWKLVASQHVRPREAILEHAINAAGLHGLTEGAARPDRPVEADRCEQRAEEHLQSRASRLDKVTKSQIPLR